MNVSPTSQLVAIDWGTTTLRATLLDAAGTIKAHRTAPTGITAVADRDFEGSLLALVEDWLGNAPAIVASGMIGSQQGWFEVPYVTAPVTPSDIVAGLRRERLSSGLPMAFVPGVLCRDDSGRADVMRGEETQVLGAAEDGAAQLCVLPGTHSKWVRTDGQTIGEFRTFLTGELYALLSQHSILAATIRSSQHRADGFARGLNHAAESPALLHQLFATRAMMLTNDLSGESAGSYLSGLLIGHELNEALAWGGGIDEVSLIGDGPLIDLYAQAMQQRGLTCRIAKPHGAARGLLRIAEAAGLLRNN